MIKQLTALYNNMISLNALCVCTLYCIYVYVTVTAKSSHVRTKTEINFIAQA